VRAALSERAAADGQESQRPRELRRDLAELNERLERLRRAFPHSPALLERAGLSSHVLELERELESRAVPLERGAVR
jgi:hypothetical protein